jgi:hypothetical protein
MNNKIDTQQKHGTQNSYLRIKCGKTMFPHKRIFKARATKERVPLINAQMNASGSYNIFCTKIKLIFFVLIH